MKLSNIEVGHKYIITDYGNLDASVINEINKIGLIIGEVVYKHIKINNSKNVLIFDIENTTYSIHNKYASEIEVEYE